MRRKFRTLIADDHELFRTALTGLLEDSPFECVAALASGEELIKHCDETIDTIIIDHDMPGLTGMDVVTRLRSIRPDLRIVVLTGLESEQLAADYVQLGVDAMVLKSDATTELRQALLNLAAGRQYTSPRIRELMAGADAISALSARERQVIRHLARGLSNKEIARVMGIAIKTVDNHRSNIMEKLNVHNAAELIAVASRSGLID